jgi:uncharacterized membrane protein
MFLSAAHPFSTVVDIFSNLINVIASDFFDLSSRESTALLALGLGSTHVGTVWVTVQKYIWQLIELFILLGLFEMLNNKDKFKFQYMVLALICFLTLGASVILPNISADFSTLRIFHLVLFILAPICIVGGKLFFTTILRIVDKSKNKFLVKNNNAILLLLVLVPFFIFNTGFIFYFTEEVPPYTPINSNTYKNSDNLDLKINYVVYNIPTKDFFGAMWLSKNKVSAMIYSDFTSRKFLLLPYPIPENNSRFLELIDLNRLGKLPPKGTYIFLRELNTKDNILVLKRNYGNKVWVLIMIRFQLLI